MDKLRSKFSRKRHKNNETAPDEVPTIVVDSPPEDINLPYIDQTPTTSSEENPSSSKDEMSSDNADDKEETKGTNKDDGETNSEDNKSESSEGKDPKNSTDNDDHSKSDNEDSEKDKSQNENSKKSESDSASAGPRRPSLRRNSVSLPNLEDLEIQVLRDQHQRRLRELGEQGARSDFSNSETELSEDELLATTGHEFSSRRNVRRKSASSPKMLKPPGEDENGNANSNSITSINSLASLLREKIQMLPPIKKKPSNYKTKVFCGILFLTIAFLIGTAYTIHYRKLHQKAYFDKIKFNKISRMMRILNSEGSTIISSRLGTSFYYDKVHPCLPEDSRNDGSLCLEWMQRARLYLDYYELNGELKCYNLKWMSLTEEITPSDCFDISQGSGFWYGGGQTAQTGWPLEKNTQGYAPFVTGTIEKHHWGNVLKRYFINSKGVAIIVDETNPLYVSINDLESKELCFKAKFDKFAFVNRKTDHPHLNYSICTTGHPNITKLHSLLSEKSLWDGLKQKDINVINSLLTEPLWEITAASKAEFTDGTVANYTNNVIGLGFLKQGHVLINELWQKHIGDFTVDTERFQGLEETINILHRRGFRVVFTIQPFISTESINFPETVKHRLLISERSPDRKIPALTRYKSVSSAGVLDITNNSTLPWLLDRLNAVMGQYMFDAFYLDMGTAYDMPLYYQSEKTLYNPDQYKTVFVNSLQGNVPIFSVNSAVERPKAPTFVSLPQFESSWIGLRRVIPTVLTYGLIGYPFLIPGAVGGDYESPESWSNKSVSSETDVLLPDKELYIRWLQLATFLPVIKFTHLPSTYGDEKVLEMAKVLTYLRHDVVTPLLKQYAGEALDTGFPLIRPLWMLESNDPACHLVADQFSVGEDLIVAPVLYSGVRRREIYLPAGVWKDGIDGSLRKGNRWIHDYPVEENQVAYFKKMPDNTRL